MNDSRMVGKSMLQRMEMKYLSQKGDLATESKKVKNQIFVFFDETGMFPY